jgi:SAM-dependent methyltransferase
VSTLTLWHDLECGAYAEDLGLWLELAAAADGPVLDVGAGTGRVSLELASVGHEVVALDLEPELLATLRARAQRHGFAIDTVAADARTFAVDRTFALIVAPMQTVQLLAGKHAQFVERAAAHLRPGGILAVAIANPPSYDGDLLPLPDMMERDGWVWFSQPVAIRPVEAGALIERRREAVSPEGERTITADRIVLAHVTPDDLEAAGRAHGLHPLPGRRIPETDDYIGSDVVMLRA